jgi:hypothetical protein
VILARHVEKRRPVVVAELDWGRPTPACGYAIDHSWLIGRLHYDPARRTWSVRYASASSGDRFGGELELVHTGPMVGFRTGETVRVEGQLIDPLPHQVRPSYRVRSLQAMSR